MGTIRDRIIQRRREQRSSITGPKTALGNYRQIKLLKDRVVALEEHVDQLQDEIEELRGE